MADNLRIWEKVEDQTQVILFWLLLIAVGMGFVSSFEDGHLEWRSLGGNLSTELFGAALTYWVFERVLGEKLDAQRKDKEKREEQEELKQRLIRQLGSQVNADAIRAAEELQAHGWLQDGSLENADLKEAELSGVNLERANLKSIILSNANLQNAKLNSANLQFAHLWQANLQNAELVSAKLQNAHLSLAKMQFTDLWLVNFQGADLMSASLEGADLLDANLAGADLRNVNLQRANLHQANLCEASLDNAKFNEQTILPDSPTYHPNNPNCKFWTPLTDMSRYTDPTHPDFWQPEWAKKRES